MSATRFVAVAAPILALGAAAVATFWRQPVTFNVTARTELLNAVAGEGAASRWSLTGAALYDGCGAEPETFTGQLSPASGASLRFERLQEGPLRIRLRTEDDGSVGDLYDDADEYLRSLADCAVLRIEPALSSLFLVTGAVEIGTRAGFQTTASYPLLRSGSVSMLGQSLLGRSKYDGGSVQLDLGDFFEVVDPLSASQGFVLVDEDPGMVAVFRSVGATGHVRRFATEGYDLHVPLWTRLTNDPVLGMAWAVFFSVLGPVQVAVRWLRGSDTDA